MDKKASRVLIVDDMPVNRMIISSLLASNGVLSDQTQSGAECLELCEKNEYDLILMDHRMPDMDGIDTFQALKEMFARKGRSVPVVCHTTDEGRNNINLYKAAGFADVLIKPIDPARLSEILMTYLPEEDKLAMERDRLLGMAEGNHMSDITDEDVSAELDKLPMWLKTVPHIDLVAGISGCGSAADYIDALYIFYSSIEEKAKDLDYCFRSDDLTMLKLGAHSLKSMARLIGAKTLCRHAETVEKAAGEGDHQTINVELPALLSSYRIFLRLLEPLKDDETIRQLLEQEDKKEIAAEESPAVDNSRTILFINPHAGIVSTGTESKLKEAGFKVISIPDEPDKIIANRFIADIVIYYPVADEKSHITLTMNFLGEICQDDSKLLCLIGDSADLKQALSANGAHRISRVYTRPVDIPGFVRDILRLSEMLREYHRKKNIFIVDDDPDYLSLLERWFYASYNVSCFSSGSELMDGISAVVPDLILMDYEMPMMDGYELMKSLRSDPSTHSIPVIFLTGKNDRDHVMRIMEYKPDGYLLKSSHKELLLDAVKRFFSENLFRNSFG